MRPLNDLPTTVTLEDLLDELCSPDLTLSRANVLRHRLTQLLESLQVGGAGADDRSLARIEIQV